MILSVRRSVPFCSLISLQCTGVFVIISELRLSRNHGRLASKIILLKQLLAVEDLQVRFALWYMWQASFKQLFGSCNLGKAERSLNHSFPVRLSLPFQPRPRAYGKVSQMTSQSAAFFYSVALGHAWKIQIPILILSALSSLHVFSDFLGQHRE